MNKKRLSVVMAGAMLASSVAPVLVAEETTVTELQNDVKAELKDLRVGDIVKLVDLGHDTVKEDGKDVIISTTSSTKYTEVELKYGIEKELLELKTTMDTEYENLIDASAYDEDNKKYVITLDKNVYINGDGVNSSDIIELTTKSNRLNFKKYIDKTTKDTVTITGTNKGTVAVNFAGFPEAAPILDDIEEKVVESFTITSGGDTFKIGDLYDAPFLTTKGQELLDAAKEAASLDSTTNKAKGFAVRFVDEVATPAGTISDEISDLSTLKADKNGNYKVAVYIGNAARISERLSGGKWDETKLNDYDVYYVTGTSRAEIATALGWIDATSAKVDVLAGEDRYATAVKIAKEVNLVGGKDVTKHIVLVNGGSLVDGLAASPLAKYLGDKDSTNAPILLTKANELPRATKRYLKELIDQETNKEVTVHIVGGEAVVSDSVKKELRELGLRVERLGGENREATSMAVAEKVDRVFGSNRKATNAEVINKFYKGDFASKPQSVIVAKDDELIDALTSANLSVEHNAPIVLGTKSLSKDQINAIVTNAKTAKKVYQVGGNVAKEVVKTVAEALNLI